MATKYKLTDTQVRHLAIICYREQGDIDAGVRACASHMCNYYEKYQKKNYSSVYECTFGSGWYWNKEKNDAWIAAHPNVPNSVIKAVREVIVEGKRTLPEYVDEYDCLIDIKTATNNGVAFSPKDRTKYKKDVTKITNIYGSSYTFYCFPDGVNGYCDAFGYISKGTSTSITTTTNTSTSTITTSSTSQSTQSNKTTVKLPEIRNGSCGSAVSVLQGLLDLMGYVGENKHLLDIDGEFGENTVFAVKSYQKSAGLTVDGVCGANTWKKLKGGLKY